MRELHRTGSEQHYLPLQDLQKLSVEHAMSLFFKRICSSALAGLLAGVLSISEPALAAVVGGHPLFIPHGGGFGGPRMGVHPGFGGGAISGFRAYPAFRGGTFRGGVFPGAGFRPYGYGFYRRRFYGGGYWGGYPFYPGYYYPDYYPGYYYGYGGWGCRSHWVRVRYYRHHHRHYHWVRRRYCY
jgi:hypothetical protein